MSTEAYVVGRACGGAGLTVVRGRSWRWPTTLIALGGLLLGAASTPGAPAGAGAAPQAADTVVARVAGKEITVGMLQSEMVRRSGGEPGRFADAAARQALLDAVIDDAVLLERARAAGYDRDPEIQATLERLLVAHFREAELNQLQARVAVSDAEVEAEYQRRIADFTTPGMSRGAFIRIAIPQGLNDAKRAELRTHALAVLEQARSLPSKEPTLGALAAQFSDDRTSRYRGGDIGWIVQDDSRTPWPPEVVAALLGLDAPGALAPLVEAPDGLYVIKLIERRAPQQRPLAVVAEQLRPALLRRKQQQLEAEWLARLRGETPVQIDQDALKAITPPSGAAQRVPEPRPPGLPPG